eukprot:COSAG06_NODE_10208_length_1726_cov_3.044253_1_plen_352_part_10
MVISRVRFHLAHLARPCPTSPDLARSLARCSRHGGRLAPPPAARLAVPMSVPVPKAPSGALAFSGGTLMQAPVPTKTEPATSSGVGHSSSAAISAASSVAPCAARLQPQSAGVVLQSAGSALRSWSTAGGADSATDAGMVSLWDTGGAVVAAGLSAFFRAVKCRSIGVAEVASEAGWAQGLFPRRDLRTKADATDVSSGHRIPAAARGQGQIATTSDQKIPVNTAEEADRPARTDEAARSYIEKVRAKKASGKTSSENSDGVLVTAQQKKRQEEIIMGMAAVADTFLRRLAAQGVRPDENPLLTYSQAGHCAARGSHAHHRADQLADWPRSGVRFPIKCSNHELSYALLARA